ncbi:prepilin-type N-terminal cleavage/methylation domain-containing protein [Lujinxingia sediminis]|uniref:Prepilin-type N-terminal cleavage/methylation domain-containing protein n=1 Tax=Lujinxingia sediminis TaxID=2480984 RepID=A0ABY0CTG3_9DELT|nr:type II secretion system protein GspG [Lujinxingia sediminis]RVU44896.1 prepilin-type N-terminal cleavage/methylation domain-containing protein [Lujinxingia sediminis]
MKTMKRREEMVRAAASIKSARGMTLVEIMIVITIMASIMGVVGVFVFGAIDKANEREATIEIQQLSQLVNTFYLTTSPNRLPNELSELTQGPAPLTKEVKADPWGNDYVYVKSGNRDFEIFSVGPDGSEGTEDDVRAE